VSVPSAGLNLRNKWRATKLDSVEFWCGYSCQVFATGSWFWRQAEGAWEEGSCPGGRLFQVVKIWV
jgi:hypothetical protein